MKVLLDNRRMQTVVGWCAGMLVRLLRASLRSEEHVPEETRKVLTRPGPVIGCFWHGRLLSLVGQRQVPPEAVDFLVSPHRDGLLLSRALARLGCKPHYGSSNRDGVKGLRALLQAVGGEGRIVAITPDGPRGPIQQAKIGAIKLAQLTGAPIVPLSASARFGHRFSSWDRFLLPLPFARAYIAWGAPITVPRNASDADLERYRLDLETNLNKLTAEADAALGHAPATPSQGVNPR